MIRGLDVAWLAGLLEGEGSFGYYRGCATIQLQMVDRDVVARAASLLGVSVRAPWRRKDGHQWVYPCVAFGPRAIGWMMTIYPLLGERRRRKVAEVLARWRASSRMPRLGRNIRRMATCRPDRFRSGRGLCRSCYMRQYRADRKAA